MRINRGASDRELLRRAQGNRCFARLLRTGRGAHFLGLRWALVGRGGREFAARRVIEIGEILLRYLREQRLDLLVYTRKEINKVSPSLEWEIHTPALLRVTVLWVIEAVQSHLVSITTFDDASKYLSLFLS